MTFAGTAASVEAEATETAATAETERFESDKAKNFFLN